MGLSEKRILVVDDEEPIRDFLSLMLTDEGYEVKAAQDGDHALQILGQDYQPHLILLDMRMPGMDGETFAEAYRQLPVRHAPIIMLSAATDAARFSTQIKPVDYLAKPFDLNQLADMVERYTNLV